jgi:hypothetical protein
MRLITVLTLMLLAAPVVAQNLLVNPDFDLDPTLAGNGWVATGTGVLAWIQGDGDPSPPSARTTQQGAESMILCQCVRIVGGATYDFSARSYTHAAYVPGTNSVSLSVYPTLDCSGAPIENVLTDQETFPSWAFRERIGYVAPANARSARIELFSAANGETDDISWDSVVVDGPPLPVDTQAWGCIKALYRGTIR